MRFCPTVIATWAVFAATPFAVGAQRAGAPSPTVLSVCEHGTVKSLIAKIYSVAARHVRHL